MFKKFTLYTFLIIFSINLGNANLFKLFSFIRQRISIYTLKEEKINICYPLQNKIENYVLNFRNSISISILSNKGEFIVDVNGDIPRIPASNQKILSSAFSLDNLGPYYTLNTSLRLLPGGGLYIHASGDPDFDITHLGELVGVLNNKNKIINSKTPIIIKDQNPSDWWPSAWSNSDRKEEYGAPITRYSIASNASQKALYDPISNFKDELKLALEFNNISQKYFIKTVNEYYSLNHIKTINTIKSAPLYVLLNLVNSESHNFTSEVVFRHSLRNWSNELPNKKYSEWLNRQNIRSEKFIFSDASGLSRENRVTTYGLSQFLRRMQNNRFSEYYFSSFSILGVRGSLSKVDAPMNLKGKILAKSGTLNNVKSLSGVILDKGKIFSIIVNEMDNSLKYIIDILSIIYKDHDCT